MARRKVNTVEVLEENKEIIAGEYINVMNIYPYALTLTTEPYGRGRVFNFSKFGETKRISYQHLVSILENHPTFAEKGFFYILDKRVIDKHGLGDVYEKILDKERLEKIFDTGSDAVELYKEASDAQREFINSVLIRRMSRDEYVDLNVVSRIQKIAGVDLMSEAQKTKELMKEE